MIFACSSYYCDICLMVIFFLISTVPSTFNWNSTVKKSCLFSHLFSCLFIKAWTHGYLFYSVGYYILLFIFILLLKLSQSGHWKLFFTLSLVSFQHTFIVFLSKHFFIWGTIGALVSFCNFPPPGLTSTIFQRALIPLIGEWYLESKTWGLGILMVWNVIASRSS